MLRNANAPANPNPPVIPAAVAVVTQPAPALAVETTTEPQARAALVTEARDIVGMARTHGLPEQAAERDNELRRVQ